MVHKPDELLRQGVQLHQQGLLPQAKLLYAAALMLAPDHLDALSYMGLLAYQMGEGTQACEWLGRAAKLAPADVSIRVNLGGILSELGRYDEAIAHLDAALSLDPQHTQAYYNRGVAYQKSGALERAVADYDTAICLHSDLVAAYANRGNALRDLGQVEEAIQSYDAGLLLEPNAADLYRNKGAALMLQKRYLQALHCFDRASQLDPTCVDTVVSRGSALARLKRLEEAEQIFARAIQMGSARSLKEKAQYLICRGEVFGELKQHDKARSCFEMALQLDPDNSAAHLAQGVVDYAEGMYEQAILNNQKAIASEPRNPEAYSNWGMALQQLGRVHEAMDCFNKALEIQPDYADALTNRGLLHLLRREFARGWKDYAHRRFTDRWRNETQPGSKPEWQGKADFETLWLRGEQGIGDTVLYASMLVEMKAMPGRKIVTLDARLKPLFERSFPEFEFLDRNQPLAEESYDQQVGLGDIGQWFRSDLASFRHQPRVYLKPNRPRVHLLRQALVAGEGLICGLAWSSPKAKLSAEKSIALKDFESVLRLPGMTFVNLQYGDVSDDIAQAEQAFGIRIHQAEGVDVFHDLDGLAALIEACDVVVSSSNSAVHLAGALGKKTFLLVPHGRGRLWYWHEDDGPSLWYPSIEVCSPSEGTDWSAPMRRISQSIQEMAHA